MDEAARTRLRRRQVGIVLQFGQLVPDLSVLENVALPLLFEGHERGAARTAAADWLEQAGLGAERDVRPAELSAGQAQRAAVARALVTGPRVIFADEPTGSMDTLGGEHLLNLLLVAARERDAALVLVTHDNVVARPRRPGGPHPGRSGAHRCESAVKPATAIRLALPAARTERGRLVLVAASTATAGALLLAAARIAAHPSGGAAAEPGLAPYVTQDGLRPGVVAADRPRAGVGGPGDDGGVPSAGAAHCGAAPRRGDPR
jgi:hypothetical protein